jgi:hypothetical protein
VIELLKRERGRLEALANALLERETLDQPEAYEVAGVEPAEVGPDEEARATAEPPLSPARSPGETSSTGSGA